MKLVIVTGMSGAGKTIALKMLEDLGFYCVDNLPVSLVDKFVQLVSDGGDIKKAALRAAGNGNRKGEGPADIFKEKGRFHHRYQYAFDQRAAPGAGEDLPERGRLQKYVYHRHVLWL